MKNDQIIESENIDLSSIKHPLQNTWSFWMYTNTSKDWSKNLVELTTFDTVEDYWSIYHYTKTPSELPIGQDYAVFKKGIRPMWEDPANEQGGRWLLTLDRKRDAEQTEQFLYFHCGDVLRSLTLKELCLVGNNYMCVQVLMLIGEILPHGEEICGVVVNVRPKCKVGVWVTNLKQKSANLEIGQKLKEQLPTNTRLCLHSHNSNQQIHSL